MKNFTKKLFCLVICIALLFSTTTVFIGCGGEEEGGSDEILLSIGYDNGGYGLTWLNHLVEKFCKANNIKEENVQIEAQKGISDVLNDRFSTEVKLRDIFMGTGSVAREWASKGFLEPIDSVFTTTLASGKTVKDSLISDNIIELGHYKDHYYSLPSDGGAWGIYYNKTLFEQNGWQVPKTVDELMALCKTIVDADKGITPFVCSSDITNYWDFLVMNWVVQLMGIDGFNTFCQMESKDLFDADSEYGKAKLKALEAWTNLVKNERYVKSNSSNFEAAQSLFAQGKIAMMPNGNWFEHEILDALEGTGYELSIMDTPVIEGAKTDGAGNVIRVSYSGEGSGWVIPAKAKHKDMAKKFLAFAVEEEQLRDYMVDCGGIMPYECDYTSVVSKLTVCQKSVYDMVNGAKTFRFVSTNPITYASARIGFWAQGLPYSAILNGKDPAAVIDDEESYINAEWDNLVRLANN